ncbi:TfuA-like protein [Streptomyces sp. NBC_01795]|uniref:TfuA-like protein n=2 Tax=Streptomyces TaxID=1883 RepID=UPI002DD8240D|nr:MULTISPECIES: TfuA-like protein [unclassified Streptomyces]WSA95875.1 TfuA-like protein [Streptomyces sp. NBC_01795]WSS11499.1 TfuA-like protein [Streptomyces sp. NBC_01186]
MRVHVFHGPSVTVREVSRILPTALRYPPVRHGDLLALHACPGDLVLIIDGVFHSAAPVRHKEILWLLARGVAVAGAASMGALRAAELYPYGMRGVGRIFAMYQEGTIDGDDEVAVAHTPATEAGADSADSVAEIHPLSVALVDIRAALEDAVRAKAPAALDRTQADRLLRLTRSIPYPHRSAAVLRKAAERETGLSPAVTAWWTGADGPLSGRPGLKHADALTALTLVADGRLTATSPKTDGWSGGSWYTPQLGEWVSRYRARSSQGAAAERVPLAAELQHQQLYDPHFPARWRHFVLTWIAGMPEQTKSAGPAEPAQSAEPTARRALTAARLRGLAPGTLTSHQVAQWLASGESELPDPAEQLLRMLVRSSRLSAAGAARFTDPERAAGLLDGDIDSASAVRAAWRLNEAVAASAPHRSVHRLRTDLLIGHLADQWCVPPGDRRALAGAAGDRGFVDVAEAVEAARAFYLHASDRVDV